MFFSRRLFVASLTHTGCALGFAPLLMAEGDAASMTTECLRQTISNYGSVVDLKEQDHRVEVQVLIRDVRKMPRACEDFSRAGAVYANGNDLQFDDGPRRIRIRHRV